MERIHEAAPKIEVAFRSADRDRALGWLASGELDFRMGQWPRPAPSFRSKPLFRDHLVCIARRDHPAIGGRLSVEQFLGTPHVRMDTPRVGVSMTGVGERILVKLAAKRLADLVGDGVPLESAALRVLEEVGPGAGLVALDAEGTVVERRNTPFMATAARAS